jgi:hypothetical protein
VFVSNPQSDDSKRNWWTTLPGILSSFGGFVAALTGLLVALNQTGVLPVKTAPAATPTAAAATTTTTSTATTTSSGNSVLDLISNTRQMQVLGTTGCDGTKAVMVRFKDDGTSGCAIYGDAIRGTLESGATVVLIPVTSAGRGTVFDLLYNDQGSQTKFVGYLPGDGTGNLTVSLENGAIVERNGPTEKRSTVRSGHVVPAGLRTSSNDATDAQGAVRTYYELWNARRLSDAYALLSEHYRAQHPYAEWQKTHTSDFRIVAQTAETPDPLTVAVIVQSTSRAGSTVSDQEYRGTWTLVRESAGLKLDSAALTKTK